MELDGSRHNKDELSNYRLRASTDGVICTCPRYHTIYTTLYTMKKAQNSKNMKRTATLETHPVYSCLMGVKIRDAFYLSSSISIVGLFVFKAFPHITFHINPKGKKKKKKPIINHSLSYA